MTPALWLFLPIQVAIVLAAFGLCVLPLTDRLPAKRFARFGTAALLVSLAVSLFTYLSALMQSFAAEGPPSEKAARLATHITTMMNARWMAVVFAILIGVAIKVQDARRRSLPPTA